METWTVLLATHERAAVTRRCLEALVAQEAPGVELAVVLCDAGSRDGTIEAVREVVPDAVVLERDADLFWCSGMRVAWEEARRRGGSDGYLWLNDDTRLDPDAIARLVGTRDALASEGRWPAIVAGATRDPETGETTYSGVERNQPLRPMAWIRVEPDPSRPIPAETMNGNCVLIPAEVAERVGNLDPTFTHAMGDFDYGLRARRYGFEVVVAPGTVGTCPRNPPPPERSVRQEWKAQTGPKGLPPREWATFVRRWGGPLWPMYVVSPYVRRLAKRARSHLSVGAPS